MIIVVGMVIQRMSVGNYMVSQLIGSLKITEKTAKTGIRKGIQQLQGVARNLNQVPEQVFSANSKSNKCNCCFKHGIPVLQWLVQALSQRKVLIQTL